MTKTIEVRLVRNEADHEAALARLEQLWTATDEDSLAEADALVGFVHAFEQRTNPPFESKLDPVDIITHAMSDDVGHTRAELNKLVGYSSRASEILARRRPLTLDMIRAISASWGIPVAVLTQPYELVKADQANLLNARMSNRDGEVLLAGVVAAEHGNQGRSAELLESTDVKKRTVATTAKRIREVVEADLAGTSKGAEYSNPDRKRGLATAAKRQRLSAKKA